MTESEIREKIAGINVLPSASAMVIRNVRDPNIDAAKLRRSIELDQSLTCNILKVINLTSSTASRVGSIQQVIDKVGQQKLFQLANASMADPVVRHQARGYDLTPGDLWRHSVRVAFGVNRLADILKVRIPQYAFTAALLHDIGKIVVGNFFEPNIEEIANYSIDNLVPFEEAEKEILGFSHAEAGLTLLEAWNFPDELIQCVRDHHHPPNRNPSPVTDLIHIVNYCVKMKEGNINESGLRYHQSNEAANRLGFTSKVGAQLAAEIDEATAEIQNLMDLAGN